EAHEAFRGLDRRPGLDRRAGASLVADEDVAVRGERHDRRHHRPPARVRDHVRRAAVVEVRDAAVGRPEVDADYTLHCGSSSFSTSRKSVRTYDSSDRIVFVSASGMAPLPAPPPAPLPSPALRLAAPSPPGAPSPLAA